MPSNKIQRVTIMLEAVSMVALLLLLAMIAAQSVQAQTYKVIYSFTGGTDGASPRSGVILGADGDLYGTASQGGYTGDGCGQIGCGTVFRMKPSSFGWTLDALYTFHMRDGADPLARVNFGRDGTLYGTTFQGGREGTVFNLRPSANTCGDVFCPWTESVLWNFTGPDGAGPTGDLVFDGDGYLYGTTPSGGSYNSGVVYELMPRGKGEWTENVIYSFGQQASGGRGPWAGVIFDKRGHIYTTTFSGGPLSPCGVVVELLNSSSGWGENDLHVFECAADGEFPYGGVIFDRAGNLYGTTSSGGLDNGGTLFELTSLTPKWGYDILANFDTDGGLGRSGPLASLTIDTGGNLYGTTYSDGPYGAGSVFTWRFSNGSWTYNSLHDFTGGSDGGLSYSQVTLDASGNLYGSASSGGTYGKGVIWEITP